LVDLFEFEKVMSLVVGYSWPGEQSSASQWTAFSTELR